VIDLEKSGGGGITQVQGYELLSSTSSRYPRDVGMVNLRHSRSRWEAGSLAGQRGRAEAVLF
jgi:hypothetical protein